MRLLLLLLLISVPSLARAQGPSLEETMSFLESHLPKMGGKLEANPDDLNYLYVHPRAEGCSLTVVEWKFTGPKKERKGVRSEVTLDLAALGSKIKTKSKDGAHTTLLVKTKNGDKTLIVYVEEKLGASFGTKAGKTGAWKLYDKDDKHALRVAKALEHAIGLCAGGSKASDASGEPF